MKNAVAFAAAVVGFVATGANQVTAQDITWGEPRLGLYGVPGILEMPTAHALSDAELGISYSNLGEMGKTNFVFQITPRLTGVFRYSWVDSFRNFPVYFDRSFDIRYLLTQESDIMPAITVGLQDFGGTGIYSSEYVVATKTFGRLRTTAGLGWGRIGSSNGITNPLGVIDTRFETRPGGTSGGVGRVEINRWFRGDVSPFVGAQYLVNDHLSLNAEYSPDAYVAEEAQGVFKVETPFNFGASYRFDSGITVGAAYLYGTQLSLNLGLTFDVSDPASVPGGREGAPLPVNYRPEGDLRSLGWSGDEAVEAQLRKNTLTAFANEGLRIDSIQLEGERVTVQFRNTRYVAGAEALGRAARVLTYTMPSSVEEFVLIPVSTEGLPASRITFHRKDIEELAYSPDASWQSFARAGFEDAESVVLDDLVAPEGRFPRATAGFSPYLASSYFDPAEPIRLDLGLQANFSAELTQGLIIGGSVRHKLLGNRGDLPVSSSALPRVRTDGYRYAVAETTLHRLTSAYYFRPGQDLYGRVTLGYLESMYAGVSSELLWKPVDSRVAFGVEANYVVQRDFDQRLGLRDYSVVTGHASMYLEGDNGFYYQVDAGRYLAGDWGATFAMDREFDNGIRLGAFATFTDVSFEDFGEGSFDKGMRFTIPLSAISGQATQRSLARTIRPVQRDGGARVSVPGRLYGPVREFHLQRLQGNWGRFWR